MAHRFHTLDVFTDTVLSGNPLAVVLEADDLDDAAMQRIAREFNLSETVFVLKPENPAHTAKLRIFTPARELPFAGHPTVGTAVLLAEEKFGTDAEHEALVVLEETIGVVRCGVVIKAGDATYGEFDVPKLPDECGKQLDKQAVAAALGLTDSDLCFDNHRPTGFSAGVAFAFVPVRDAGALSRAKPMNSHWAAGNGFGFDGAFVYTRAAAGDAVDFKARMFAPAMGVPEDPATGSAVAAFAGVLAKFEALPDGRHTANIAQGVEMGRPSRISLELELVGGRLVSARIGGQAVRVQSGELAL